MYTTSTHLYFAPNTWVPSFARCRLTNDSRKTKRFLSVCEISAITFCTRNDILHIIVYHYMTSYGHSIMIIVDSCKMCFSFRLHHASNDILLLLMFVAEKKILLLMISLKAYIDGRHRWRNHSWNQYVHLTSKLQSLIGATRITIGPVLCQTNCSGFKSTEVTGW